MKKTLFFCLAVLLVCLTAGALAESAPSIALTVENDGFCLTPQKVKGTYYLFVPGPWAGRQVTLSPLNGKSVTVNGVAYDGPAPAPALTQGDKWTVGKQKVTVLIGSPQVPALCVSVDEAALAATYKTKSKAGPAVLRVYAPEGMQEGAYSLDYLKCRGNSTFQYAKKPYNIKLTEKASLCGLKTARKYVLLADALDVSLLRNRITLEMFKASGARYALSCLHVDLYLNGVYRGVYLLTQKIEASSGSVDVVDQEKQMKTLSSQPLDSYPLVTEERSDLQLVKYYDGPTEPADITGGYLLETEKRYRFEQASDAGFITRNNMSVYVKEPEHATKAQILYIGGVVDSFHRAILQKDGVDPQTGKRYDEIFDAESLALKYLLEEISKNFDARQGSQFFYKDCDTFGGLVYTGPAWDYDLAYGVINQPGFQKHMNSRNFYLSTYTERHTWYNNLIRHPEFEQRVIDRYRDTYRPIISVLLGDAPAPEGSTLMSIDDYAAQMEASAAMNYKIWSASSAVDARAGKTFAQGVAYLKKWFVNRSAFLDKQWLKDKE